MDLNEIWQEHKRFILMVAAGFLTFFVANSVIEGIFQSDIRAATSGVSKSSAILSKELYQSDDRVMAELENESLRDGYDKLVAAAAFRPRPEFDLAQNSSTPQNAYITAVERLEDRLIDLASQKRAILPDGLGLDTVQTLNVDLVERHLHAVDLLERAVQMALEAGVRRVRGIHVRLDPAFEKSRGLGAIERTRVQIETDSTAEAVTEWLALAETPLAPGASGPAAFVRLQPLPFQDIEMSRVSAKENEVRTSVTFVVVRVHELPTDDEDDTL